MADTRTIQQTFEAVARATGSSIEQVASMVEQRALIRTPALAADIAKAAAFLASEGARTIRGAIINAGGGRTMGGVAAAPEPMTHPRDSEPRRPRA
jgi:enoyl-[acyl-carrier-protein] reductase (NADH)